eukprot:862004-Prymnesium_polylepis.1
MSSARDEGEGSGSVAACEGLLLAAACDEASVPRPASVFGAAGCASEYMAAITTTINTQPNKKQTRSMEQGKAPGSSAEFSPGVPPRVTSVPVAILVISGCLPPFIAGVSSVSVAGILRPFRYFLEPARGESWRGGRARPIFVPSTSAKLTRL